MIQSFAWSRFVGRFLECLLILGALNPLATAAETNSAMPLEERAPHGSGSDPILVRDIFGRVVNDHRIVLVDWPGYMANPYVKLRMDPPAGFAFPIIASLAANSPRLMFDTPSTLSSRGPSKVVKFDSPESHPEFLMEICPKHDPGDEEYELTIKFRDAKGRQSGTRIPIHVISQKEIQPPRSKLVFDYRYDTINHNFDDPACRRAAESAMNDWFSYFEESEFDTVPAGSEIMGLVIDDWKGHDPATNNAPYRGFWVFCRGIHGPYSTGYPNNGVFGSPKFHQLNGNPTPFYRSFAYIFHFHSNATVFASVNDDQWYLADPYKVTDVYGLTMHEFGHAIAYNSTWAGMARYKNNGGEDPDVVQYMGQPVPLDNSYHIPGDFKYFDRLSGQNGAYGSRFPPKRWMLTKLALLIAKNAGWHLRALSPFIPAQITSPASLPPAFRSTPYHYQLEAAGGVPSYDWLVMEGQLPPGLSLNRFTGEIGGAPTSTAQPGVYDVKIQLRDCDEQAKPATKAVRIILQ